jgi:serine/threonine protein kinase
MDHPNIIAYHDSFEKDGILMIEMEYADGGNLAEFLSKQKIRMEEKDILDIVYQMVSAIRYMHAHNVLHRDLKTANIFLTREQTVKIGIQLKNYPMQYCFGTIGFSSLELFFGMYV